MNFLLLAALPAVAYVTPGFESFDPHQDLRSVGVFGSFGKGAEVQDRDNYGLLTFELKKDAPDNTLVWSNYFGSKDLVLGHASFPGALTSKTFTLKDWTTGFLQSSTTDGNQKADMKVTFSRTFPAVLYQTTAGQWSWKPGDFPFSEIAYRDPDGKVTTKSPSQPLPRLASPWIVAWNPSKSSEETVPILIRLERKPVSMTFGQDLTFKFKGAADHIVVMPLYGIRRPNWQTSLPDDAVQMADRWTRISARFPLQTDETYHVDESRQVVNIENRFRYENLEDDWHTSPLIIAPVPPITAMAGANGYAVDWHGAKVERSAVDTFLGPYAYVAGSKIGYSIPIPGARNSSPAAIRPSGDASRESSRQALDALVLQNLPKSEDTSDGGLNLEMKEFSQAYPLLDPSTQATLKSGLDDAFAKSYSPQNLQTVTDPVFGQRYVMCSKIWCAGEPFDREWYAGRQLDASAEYASWVDPTPVKANWKAILGLYSYFKIYNDWAWSGTLSSVFAYALCGDGMNFAMEGMLGTAKMAKLVDDTQTWNDATYRASKEAVNTFAGFSMSQYMKDVNYVTWTDTGYDYETKRGRYEIKRMQPSEVETGFGLDIYCDTTGIKVLRPGMFWHATAALYWNNPDLDRLYAETGLYPRVYEWEYKTMPSLFPAWNDRNAIEKYENQPFGSNLAIAHIDARANLFGQSSSDLTEETDKLRSDSAPLYKVRLQEDLTTAGIPQLWTPVGARLAGATWDAKTKTLKANIVAHTSDALNFDWNWRSAPSATPDAGPRPKSVQIDGHTLRFEAVKGGFYRVSVPGKPGTQFNLEISYSN